MRRRRPYHALYWDGHFSLVLALYNSLGRKRSTFTPLKGKKVMMYTCGPTVYNYAHVGNFRTFTFEDVLRRYLKHKGYRVVQVKNITDVEDRIIEGMKRTGKSLKDLTEFYTSAFMEDLRSLNIEEAERYPRATEYIDDMVDAIESLMKKGYAYKADDGSVYFSIKKFPKYGRLSGIKQSEVKSGTRVSMDHYEKMGANDFALWKAWDPSDGPVFWETRLGKGRPGWHIECSVMAMRLLGPSIDIHTGGKDLKFPHHENEIAQSEALTGKRFVKFWLHAGFLSINSEKMSKSLGNMITLRELLEQGWNPRAVRLFLIGAHYRDELNMTESSMRQADASLRKIDEFHARLLRARKSAVAGKASSASKRSVNEFLRRFEQAMDDDLNTPKALASLFSFQREINPLIDSRRLNWGDIDLIVKTLAEIDQVLGIMQLGARAESVQGKTQQKDGEEAEIATLVNEREDARRLKDYARADSIRERLKSKGVVVDDTPDGPVWHRLSTPSRQMLKDV